MLKHTQHNRNNHIELNNNNMRYKLQYECSNTASNGVVLYWCHFFEFSPIVVNFFGTSELGYNEVKVNLIGFFYI